MLSDVATARGHDPGRHTPGDDCRREEKPRGYEAAPLCVEGEHDARRNEGEEDEHAGETPEPSMPRPSSLKRPRRQQKAERECDGSGRDVDSEGGDPKGFEPHRQLFDDEGRERIEIEIGKARHSNEGRPHEHREEEQASGKMGGQARHISSDGRSRQKICSRRRRLSFGIRALIHPRTLNCQRSDPYQVRGMPGINRLLFVAKSPSLRVTYTHPGPESREDRHRG